VIRFTSGLATAVGILALVALSIVRTSRPPAAVPASAPATTFSSERALVHVRAIAERPHPIGSADHDRVRDYVMAQLAALGLNPAIQQTTAVGTRYRESGRVQNIVARMQGRTVSVGQATSNSGRAVLLMAHYDGVEAGPAASDDGAGTAALLETARALRAGPPLTHDVIFLFTDGEEAGLLGSAAFVREHPWAKDVDVVLDFEARGTTGRSFMFETGPGNLDAARVLRGVPNVTAGSVFTTIYRVLPNDTDLSELAVLGRPALNFAFADGVERYHTSHDDVAYLDPRSLQHHGSQALALARAFGNGPLPRPFTGDAAFFDLPLIGLVVYPESLSLLFAIAALALVCVVGVRVMRHKPRWIVGAAVGAAGTLVATAIGAGVGYYYASIVTAIHAHLPWGGVPSWSPVHALALTLLVTCVVTLCAAFLRRYAEADALQFGAMVVWATVSFIASLLAAGASYLFTWPVLLMAAATLVPRRRRVAAEVALWTAVSVTILLLGGLAYTTAAVMLGLHGAGGVALALLTSLIIWLHLPVVERVTAMPRLSGAAWLGAVGIGFAIVGLVTVRRSDRHPAPSILVYTLDADSSSGAWLVTPAAAATNPWTKYLMESARTMPLSSWTSRVFGPSRVMLARSVPRLDLAGPVATMTGDSTADGHRHVTLHVTAPAHTTSLTMRVRGASVLASNIDGRVVDTTRFRQRSSQWATQFWAVPPGGVTLGLTLVAGSSFELELLARSPGLPKLAGVTIPPRPLDVVPVQYGDVTIVRRVARF
jgi:hypothetical protein